MASTATNAWRESLGGTKYRSGLAALVLVALLAGLLPAMIRPLLALSADPSDQSAAQVTQNATFGIAHVGYADFPPDSTRYQMARNAGANWDRWALYWQTVEKSQGVFDYGQADLTVIADVNSGLRSDVILMNTPDFYSSGIAGAVAEPPPDLKDHLPSPWKAQLGQFRTAAASSIPQGLDQPVFADGSDTGAPGKAVNPDNYWARFVNTTVNHYKPGGILATEQGWTGERGVRHWEMWNEPDYYYFWSGSAASYARLLQVGYLATKAADPNAQVLIGGLMHWEKPYWLRDLFDALNTNQPLSRANNYYFDVVAWHLYSRSKDLFDKVAWAKQLLRDKGITSQYGVTDKEVWVNESNIPVCNDPPGPTCPSNGRGTLQEQSAFIVQAAAYALAAGASRVFTFQLYDDGVGPNEAYGLIRNPPDGRPRPAYTAYQVVTQYFRTPSVAQRVLDGSVDRVALWGTPNGKVTAIWNNGPTTRLYSLPASATSATRVNLDGTTQTIYPNGGSYSLALPGATNNSNFQNNPNDYILGGTPIILVEPYHGGPPPSPTPSPGTAVVAGYVRDNRGIPIFRATVAIGSSSATTDSTGRYQLAVAAGTYNISATALGFGYLPPMTGVQLVSGSNPAFNFTLPPGNNVLSNGGFEAGLSGWATSGCPCAPPALASGSGAHTGSNAVALGANFTGGGDVGGGANSTIRQQVTVPAGSNTVLSFVYRLTSSDPTSDEGFEVVVIDGLNATYLTLRQKTPVDWTARWFDLTPWAGKTVDLIFNVWQTSPTEPTVAYVDEASVGAATGGPYSSTLNVQRGGP